MIKKIAFFHGLESKPFSEKNKALQETFHNVFAPAMAYNQPDIFENTLNDIIAEKPELLIGSSMGGYFAYCLSTLTGIPTLLFNPAMQGRSFSPLTRLGIKAANHTVIFGATDDVIDAATTEEYFRNYGIGTFSYNTEDMGHRIPIDTFRKWIIIAGNTVAN